MSNGLDQLTRLRHCHLDSISCLVTFQRQNDQVTAYFSNHLSAQTESPPSTN